MSYRYERLSQNNINDLVDIYTDAFGKSVSQNFLNSKQDTSMFGPSYVGYIAYSEEGKAAGFYGVFPCMVTYKGNQYLAAQSGDTMTHSQHTGKGLFTALATETYNYCKSIGVHFVFGFPNKNSYPGFTKKLGWIHFDDIHAYVLRVRCIPWIRLKNTFKLQQQIQDSWFKFIISLCKKGTPFQSSCLSDSTPVVDHSADFFAYKKYEENFVVNVAGLNVWIKHDDTFLYVGDVEHCSEKEFKAVLNRLKWIAFLTGLPHIRFHGSTNAWASKMFSQFGHKMEVKYPAGGVNFSHKVPLEQMQFTLADFDTF
ncbi:MAG: GNAT family N-acetyltransferase [Bacteroidetes bacterium]|nr:GNAT family N-acetyltransferase [Bacteroidota bacterium]